MTGSYDWFAVRVFASVLVLEGTRLIPPFTPASRMTQFLTEAKTMKLIYRGITYDYAPETKSLEAVAPSRAIAPKPLQHLKYRGTTYDVNPNVSIPRKIFHPLVNLMYRGIAYSTNG